MQAVVHPLSLAAILQQSACAQLCQMAGDLGLAFVQCAGQLADAQFFLAGDQQHHPRAVLVGQALE
ncbi:hypothetical protein FQZ97_1153400 [compost metagenome]